MGTNAKHHYSFLAHDHVRESGERVGGGGGTEAWQESTRVAITLHESVHGVTVGLHGGHHDLAMLVLLDEWLADGLRATLHSLLKQAVRPRTWPGEQKSYGVDSTAVIDGECNVLDGISVLGLVLADIGAQLWSRLWVQRGRERELDLWTLVSTRRLITFQNLHTSPWRTTWVTMLRWPVSKPR